ncbi:MAG: hypothetical protein GY757_27985 [bacterium]|nr:hypothetical protein [bacterium]
MKEMQHKKIAITAAILVLLFAMGLRLNAPTADLPSHITFSGSILTDEGNQCHNSRSKALYDEWYPDDWRITNYNPFLPYMKYALFKGFGVGLFQMRLVSHIFAFLSLLFFFLTLKSYLNQKYGWALVGTFLLGINFLYVMYNKIGTFETSIIFWVILTLYFIEKYRSRRKVIFLILTGGAAFMAVIFKSIMAYLLPVPFVACVLMSLFPREGEGDGVREGIRNIILIIFGVFLVALPWYLLHYLPNREWILSTPGKFMGNLMLPKSLAEAYRNFLTFPWKDQFYKIPVVWFCSVLFIPVFLRRLFRKRSNYTEVGYTLFFLANTVVFFAMSYRPTRYFIPVIPAMVFMTVLLLKRLFSGRWKERARMRPMAGGMFGILDTLWLTGAACFCFLPLFSRYVYAIPVPPMSRFYLAAAAVLVIGSYIVKKFYKKLIWRKPSFRLLAIPLTLLLLGVSVYINLSYYFEWNRDKTFTVRDISLELRDKLDNAYIGGMTAPVAVMENKHKALWLYPNFVNWDDTTFDKYPLTHALIGTDLSREIIHYFDSWPERMAHAALLQVYHIKNYFLHLYSFEAPYIKSVEAGEPAEPAVRNSNKSKKANKVWKKDFRLVVFNPSKQVIKTRLGNIYIYPEDTVDEVVPVAEGAAKKEIVKKPGEGFEIIRGDRAFQLQPGENEISVALEREPKSLPVTVLFYLDYEHSLQGNVLRYEGEIFSGRVGFDKRELAASNSAVRYFERATRGAGFLSYGPAVPYARGFLTADFKLNFSDFKSKLKPVCQLDIYSHQDKGPVAELKVKPGDIKKNKNARYRLSTVVPETKKLEFRIQVTDLADVSFDYMDLRYYQGIFVQLEKEKVPKKTKKARKASRRRR